MLELTHHQIISLILLSVVIVSCKQSISTTSAVKHIEEEQDIVEHIEVMTFKSFPVQVNVIARGHLPDNCTFIDNITQEHSTNTLRVKITTARQSDKDCTKGNQPFEEIIPLNIEGLSAGVYVVKVNSVTDSFELGVDNISH
jgi:inhibitor of cysteine peptidase